MGSLHTKENSENDLDPISTKSGNSVSTKQEITGKEETEIVFDAFLNLFQQLESAKSVKLKTLKAFPTELFNKLAEAMKVTKAGVDQFTLENLVVKQEDLKGATAFDTHAGIHPQFTVIADLMHSGKVPTIQLTVVQIPMTLKVEKVKITVKYEVYHEQAALSIDMAPIFYSGNIRSEIEFTGTIVIDTNQHGVKYPQVVDTTNGTSFGQDYETEIRIPVKFDQGLTTVTATSSIQNEVTTELWLNKEEFRTYINRLIMNYDVVQQIEYIEPPLSSIETTLKFPLMPMSINDFYAKQSTVKFNQTAKLNYMGKTFMLTECYTDSHRQLTFHGVNQITTQETISVDFKNRLAVTEIHNAALAPLSEHYHYYCDQLKLPLAIPAFFGKLFIGTSTCKSIMDYENYPLAPKSASFKFLAIQSPFFVVSKQNKFLVDDPPKGAKFAGAAEALKFNSFNVMLKQGKRVNLEKVVTMHQLLTIESTWIRLDEIGTEVVTKLSQRIVSYTPIKVTMEDGLVDVKFTIQKSQSETIDFVLKLDFKSLLGTLVDENGADIPLHIVG